MQLPHQPPYPIDVGKARVALGDADTPGMVLLLIALWTFGPAVFGDDELEVERMDPSELWAGLNEVYGTWVTEEGENKLNALMLALDGDDFYKDPEVFMAVCNSLFDGDLGDMVTGVMEYPSVLEIMWAVMEVELARENEDEPPQFSPAVQELVNNALLAEQDDHDQDTAAVWAAYQDMLGQMRGLGVPLEVMRKLDEEYAEVMEVLEVPEVGAIL